MMKARLISLDYHVPQCDTSLDTFPTMIGHAADADVCLDDHSIAGHHCRIVCDGEQWIVSDLGTVHGTRVNGSRISEAALRPGDELGVGMMSFLVEGIPDNMTYERHEREEPLYALAGV